LDPHLFNADPGSEINADPDTRLDFSQKIVFFFTRKKLKKIFGSRSKDSKRYEYNADLDLIRTPAANANFAIAIQVSPATWN